MNKATQAYFKTKVSTTDQGQLLLLLYDGALNFLQQAREKILQKDYAAKGILISKVIDIISELSSSLNIDKGGTLAENLNNLYFLCTTRLLQANLKMNVEQLDSVSDILSGLRSAYAEIIATPEARKISAQIATKINVDGGMVQRAAHIPNPSTVPLPGYADQAKAHSVYGKMQRSAPVQASTSPAQGQAPAQKPSTLAAHARATQAHLAQSHGEEAVQHAQERQAKQTVQTQKASAASSAPVMQKTVSQDVQGTQTVKETQGQQPAPKPLVSRAVPFTRPTMSQAKARSSQATPQASEKTEAPLSQAHAADQGKSAVNSSSVAPTAQTVQKDRPVSPVSSAQPEQGEKEYVSMPEVPPQSAPSAPKGFGLAGFKHFGVQSK